MCFRDHILSKMINGCDSGLLFFLKPTSGYRCSICSCTRTKVHHTLTPLHTYTDLHLHTKNKIASFVISAEPTRFCRRRARRTDHCGVTRGRRHETSPTTVSCTRKLMDPTPPPEHTTAKKRQARSTLFDEREADSFVRASPGSHRRKQSITPIHNHLH